MGLSGETVGHAYYPEEVSKLLADDKKIWQDNQNLP